MISFKQFLTERALNFKAYKNAIEKLGALVGFELEVYVPPDHYIASNHTVKSNVDTVDVNRDIDSMSDLETYFSLSGREAREIESDYDKWVSAKREEFIDDKWEDYLDGDEDDEDYDPSDAEATARQEAEDDFDEDDYPFDDWIEDEFGDTMGLVSHYNLSPPYGWLNDNSLTGEIYSSEPDDSSDNWNSALSEDIADRLEHFIKRKVFVYDEAHGSSADQFKIVPDSSINSGHGKDGNGKGFGFEIVTPPLPASESLNVLKDIFSFISDKDFETNSSTGLHVNLSIPNLPQKLDPVKLVLFTGDEHVLKMFSRSGNTFTKPQVEALIGAIAANDGVLPSTKAQMNYLLAALKATLLNTGKYTSVNFSKLRDYGYLEFRAAGNANYHKDFEKIFELVGRLLSALELACDPQAEKAEYLKKLYKLSATIPAAPNDEDMSFIELATKKYSAQAKDLMDLLDDKDKFAKQMEDLLYGLYGVTSHRPSIKQIKDIRDLMKRAGVTGADLLKNSETEFTKKKLERVLKICKLV